MVTALVLCAGVVGSGPVDARVSAQIAEEETDLRL